ncbi:MAG: type 1 glutamine amidotransferase [Ktedonobacterales bacterium]
MQPMTLRICHLYPTLLSIAGDRGNLMAIQRRCSWRGLNTEVTEVAVGDSADFTAFDLILFHGGQDKEMDVAARDLEGKASSLRDAAESDVVILAVCAGYQLLGHYYQPFKGPILAGVGALDIHTEGGNTRFMNHLAMECDFAPGGPQRLVGFENHSGRTYLGPRAEPLGRVIAGSGNNGEDGNEGARYRQVYGTYLHGPVLPKNPWFADFLTWQGLRHRYGEVAPLSTLADGAEERAHEAAFKMALRMKGKTTAMEATAWAH